MNKEELQTKLEVLKLNPLIQEYEKLCDELESIEKSEEEIQREQQGMVNMDTFLNNLIPLVVSVLNNAHIKNTRDAWLSEFAEYPDDIVINTTSLKNYFLNYYNSTKEETFREIAYNIIIKVENDRFITISKRTDDNHWHEDEIEFEYSGNFSNIVDKEIVDCCLLFLMYSDSNS